MIVALAGALLLASCGRKAAKPVEQPTYVVWRMVGSWPGHGSSQTESFEGTEAWRIRWETRNEKSPGAGHFRVTVRSAVSGRAIEVPIDHDGLGHDIAYVTEQPRYYYLGIDSRDVDWTVTVEEAALSSKPETQ
jgi:hypothetical protein